MDWDSDYDDDTKQYITDYRRIVGGNGANTIGLYNPGNILTIGDLVDTDLESIRPIDHIVNTIKDNKDNYKLFIVKARTGSGKTLIMPPEINNNLNMPIIIGVPLQKIALSLPKIVQKIFHKSDKQVGYMVSGNSNISNNIDYVTTMTLQIKLIELYNHFKETGNVSLRDFPYKCVVIDEVHKRDEITDITLVIIKKMIAAMGQQSPIFILTSATFEFHQFINYFGIKKPNYGIQLINISGSSSNKNVVFAKESVRDWITAAADKVIEICTKIKPNPIPITDPGDIIVFIDSIKNGENIQRLVNNWADSKKYPLVTILATSSSINNDTYESFLLNTPNLAKIKKHDKPVCRRIVIGTDAIETGVTLSDAVFLIEPGLRNDVSYNAEFNCMIQLFVPITKMSAEQRYGRVGRNRDGTVYPLYTRETYDMLRETMDSFTDIEDCSMSLLTLNRLSIDPAELLSVPNPQTIRFTYDKLYMLGFVDNADKLTKLGETASKFTKISAESIRMIMAGFAYGVSVADLITMAAAIEVTFADTNIQIGDQFISTLLQMERTLFPAQYSQYDSKFNFAGPFSAKVVDQVLWNRYEYAKTFLNQHISLNNVPSELSTLMRESMDSDKSQDIIRRYKQCIYEGYKYNLMVRDIHSQQLTYNTIRGYPVEVPKSIFGTSINVYQQMGLSTNDYPLYLICKNMSYRSQNGLFKFTPTCISIMDHFVPISMLQLPEYTTSMPADVIIPADTLLIYNQTARNTIYMPDQLLTDKICNKPTKVNGGAGDSINITINRSLHNKPTIESLIHEDLRFILIDDVAREYKPLDLFAITKSSDNMLIMGDAPGESIQLDKHKHVYGLTIHFDKNIVQWNKYITSCNRFTAIDIYSPSDIDITKLHNVRHVVCNISGKQVDRLLLGELYVMMITLQDGGDCIARLPSANLEDIYIGSIIHMLSFLFKKIDKIDDVIYAYDYLKDECIAEIFKSLFKQSYRENTDPRYIYRPKSLIIKNN